MRINELNPICLLTGRIISIIHTLIKHYAVLDLEVMLCAICE